MDNNQRRARNINTLEVLLYEARHLLVGEALEIAELSIGLAIDFERGERDTIGHLKAIREHVQRLSPRQVRKR